MCYAVHPLIWRSWPSFSSNYIHQTIFVIAPDRLTCQEEYWSSSLPRKIYFCNLCQLYASQQFSILGVLRCFDQSVVHMRQCFLWIAYSIFRSAFSTQHTLPTPLISSHWLDCRLVDFWLQALGEVFTQGFTFSPCTKNVYTLCSIKHKSASCII